ncbi:hypothetical protein [Virgisporangium aurantiacum]|uniref:Uncharacterized protein n=1 Tax=Virgisporangium aurantiacum TaxID=175570 RepID=A0A8J4E7X0_9ACTN|nr:hypothetical protein Vau01_097180 [Virgisporangium aurantiacum]
MTDSPPSTPDGSLLTILTTEHFVLQTARGGTIGEANGRASIYLGAVSSGLIALGFVAGDSSRLTLFAAAVLPAILLLGWFTFARLVQTGVESMRYLTRIQRIRRWYADQSPAGAYWFADITDRADDPDEASAALRSMGMRPSFWQMLYTMANMVGALNSLIFGVAFCLAIRGADRLTLPWAASLGIGLALVAFTGHVLFQRREFTRGPAGAGTAGRGEAGRAAVWLLGRPRRPQQRHFSIHDPLRARRSGVRTFMDSPSAQGLHVQRPALATATRGRRRGARAVSYRAGRHHRSLRHCSRRGTSAVRRP